MNDEAGIHDDLIVTKLEKGFLIILNAACKENDFKILGNLISDVICGFKNNISDSEIEKEVNKKIINICKKYPIY